MTCWNIWKLKVHHGQYDRWQQPQCMTRNVIDDCNDIRPRIFGFGPGRMVMNGFPSWNLMRPNSQNVTRGKHSHLVILWYDSKASLCILWKERRYFRYFLFWQMETFSRTHYNHSLQCFIRDLRTVQYLTSFLYAGFRIKCTWFWFWLEAYSNIHRCIFIYIFFWYIF